MKLSKDTYSQHVYQINVLNLTKLLIRKIKAELGTDPQCEHFCELFRTAMQAFSISIEKPEGLIKSQAKLLFLIKPQHPAFYTWLAYFICTQEPKFIPLILQAYKQGKFGEVTNFNNSVEYLVYVLLKHVPFDHAAQDAAVLQWINTNNYPDSTASEDMDLLEKSTHALLQIATPHRGEFKLHFVHFLTNKDQRPAFNAAMEGKFLAPGKEVYPNMRANVFCDAIGRMYINGGIILNKKSEITRWICHNFIFNKKGGRGQISFQYCQKLLNGREAPFKKDAISLTFHDRPAIV